MDPGLHWCRILIGTRRPDAALGGFIRRWAPSVAAGFAAAPHGVGLGSVSIGGCSRCSLRCFPQKLRSGSPLALALVARSIAVAGYWRLTAGPESSRGLILQYLLGRLLRLLGHWCMIRHEGCLAVPPLAPAHDAVVQFPRKLRNGLPLAWWWWPTTSVGGRLSVAICRRLIAEDFEVACLRDVGLDRRRG